MSYNLRGCLYGRGSNPLGMASPTKRTGFHLAFTWVKPALQPGLARLAESPGLTTYIFPRTPESDCCVQVFILYPTHKQIACEMKSADQDNFCRVQWRSHAIGQAGARAPATWICALVITLQLTFAVLYSKHSL